MTTTTAPDRRWQIDGIRRGKPVTFYVDAPDHAGAKRKVFSKRDSVDVRMTCCRLLETEAEQQAARDQAIRAYLSL